MHRGLLDASERLGPLHPPLDPSVAGRAPDSDRQAGVCGCYGKLEQAGGVRVGVRPMAEKAARIGRPPIRRRPEEDVCRTARGEAHLEPARVRNSRMKYARRPLPSVNVL